MADTSILARLSLSLREAVRMRWDAKSSRRADASAAEPSPDALFLRAYTLARKGDKAAAAKSYQDALALDPSYADAYEGQAEALDETGQTALAREKYEIARRLRAGMRPGAPDRHFVLRQRGHFVSEVLAYDDVLKSLKRNTLPYLARGNAHLAAGHPERALADYEQALRLKPGLADAIGLKAEALSMMGRYKLALQAFDEVLAKRPDDAETLNGRAIARAALGKMEEANADWTRQMGLLESRPAARACVALRMADYAAALSALKEAQAKDPADAYWRLYRATAESRLGTAGENGDGAFDGAWPGPLLALHAGRLSETEVLQRADNKERLVEAWFQLGALAASRDPGAAERHWRKIIDQGAPSLIEYAAARNELSRLGR